MNIGGDDLVSAGVLASKLCESWLIKEVVPSIRRASMIVCLLVLDNQVKPDF
jgi:hypothetical protein